MESSSEMRKNDDISETTFASVDWNRKGKLTGRERFPALGEDAARPLPAALALRLSGVRPAQESVFPDVDQTVGLTERWSES